MGGACRNWAAVAATVDEDFGVVDDDDADADGESGVRKTGGGDWGGSDLLNCAAVDDDAVVVVELVLVLVGDGCLLRCPAAGGDAQFLTRKPGGCPNEVGDATPSSAPTVELL